MARFTNSQNCEERKMIKKCRICKREVPTKDWAYKDDLCRRCDGRERYRKSRPELTKMITELEKKSKDELIKIIISNRGNRGNINMLFAQKNWQIKHFRSRILKIRNQLDYLLKHPYSFDSSYQTEKHPRDGSSLANRKCSLKKARRIKDEESR